MAEPVITIRVATPMDGDVLSALIGASYATLARAGYDADELTAALPSMSTANPKLLASGTYYVVEADGEPAACGGWTREAPGSGPMTEGVAHIRHFATHPQHLRKGLAKMLLDRCIAEAGAAGLKALHAQSTLLAEPFYAAAGFRRLGRGRAKMGPEASLPVVEMERKLP